MESRFKINIPVSAGILLGVACLLFYFLNSKTPEFEISCFLSAFCALSIFRTGYTRDHSEQYSCFQVCLISFLVGGACMALGVLFESLFIITASWGTLMALLLWQTGIQANRKQSIWFGVFLILSFPWFDTEFHFVGVLFRYGGAFISELLAGVLGLKAQREGTLLCIEGVDISVSDACSGMSTLQGMIVIGLYLFHQKVNTLKRGFTVILAIFTIAFISNTLRIIINSFVILTFGVKFGMGITHDIVGLLVSGGLFYLFATFFPRGNNLLFNESAAQS